MVTVQEFRTAWADKENRGAAYALAEQYVAENATVLEAIAGGKTSDECVQIIEALRASNNPDMETAITMYELVKFERKQIGGSLNFGGPF